VEDDMNNDYLYDLLRGNGDPGESEWFDITKVIDVGHGMLIYPVYREGVEESVGFWETHRTEGQRGCGGCVMFNIPENTDSHRTRWELVSREPMHVEPSILCGRCGWHGFLRNGAWEPC
jgi:hypothetical protein